MADYHLKFLIKGSLKMGWPMPWNQPVFIKIWYMVIRIVWSFSPFLFSYVHFAKHFPFWVWSEYILSLVPLYVYSIPSSLLLRWYLCHLFYLNNVSYTRFPTSPLDLAISIGSIVLSIDRYFRCSVCSDRLSFREYTAIGYIRCVVIECTYFTHVVSVRYKCQL